MIRRGAKVKWPSRNDEKHIFHGVVWAVYWTDNRTPGIDGLAVVDDGLGLSMRVIPTKYLQECADSPTLVHKGRFR